MRHQLDFYAISFYELFQQKILIHLIILFAVFPGLDLNSQANIAFQNFENAGGNYNYTNTNGFLQTGNSSASDRPATATFCQSLNTAFRVSNQNAILNFVNITGLNAYILKKISIRLAAFSIASTSNGMDASDKVTISISLNGGATYSDELTVKGNGNAQWHYTTGSGIANVNYDGNNSATEFAPGGGGNRTVDGYSTLIINLPDTCTQVKLKIAMINDSNNEAWLLDDVSVSSCVAPSFTNCPSNITTSTDLNVCSKQLNYNLIIAGSPNPTLNYNFSGATIGSGSGSGTGTKLNTGITSATIIANNACGNTTCSFDVKVEDTEMPAITCPPSVNYVTTNGSCGPVSKSLIKSGSAIATDNCGLDTIYHNAPEIYAPGITKVNWTAIDIHGNSNSCIQNVTIIPYKCGQAVQVFISEISGNTTKIKWKSNVCATVYELRIRKEISPGVWETWQEWNAANGDLTHLFSGLKANSFYHYQIRTKCGSTNSTIVNDWFHTK